jgi:hypothetical protein
VIQTSATTETLGRVAALGAALAVSASLAAGGLALAQSAPSPDPDPQIHPDPIATNQSTGKSTAAPAPGAPTTHIASPVASATPPVQQATVVVRSPSPGSRPSEKARPSKRHRVSPRRQRSTAAPAAWKRLMPLAAGNSQFDPLADEQADDRSRARALSLAAIALLLVVVAGGSLLRLSARLPGDSHRTGVA